MLRCEGCGPFPLLAGVPVLVPEPQTYCRVHREAILAALVEHELADPDVVMVVDAFARAGHGTPERFSDDWTEHEADDGAPPEPIPGAVSPPWRRILAESRRSGPGAWLTRGRGSVGVTVEVACGAGARSQALAEMTERMVVGDWSLRAVLRGQARARRSDAEVVAVVLDAQSLPLRQGSVDRLVAEHLVDLLDAPDDFLRGTLDALSPRGRALVTSSEPGLGSDDDSRLTDLARAAGFRVQTRVDGLPWVRVNSSRFVELYAVQALELRRGSK